MQIQQETLQIGLMNKFNHNLAMFFLVPWPGWRLSLSRLIFIRNRNYKTMIATCLDKQLSSYAWLCFLHSIHLGNIGVGNFHIDLHLTNFVVNTTLSYTHWWLSGIGVTEYGCHSQIFIDL